MKQESTSDGQLITFCLDSLKFEIYQAVPYLKLKLSQYRLFLLTLLLEFLFTNNNNFGIHSRNLIVKQDHSSNFILRLQFISTFIIIAFKESLIYQ